MPRDELAILRSVLYSSLFEYPLTLAELRRTLLESTRDEAGILRSYQSSAWLQSLVELRDGWFFPRGRSAWIAGRQQREVRSLALLDRNRLLLKSICALPFIRLVALSGSVAALNADSRADLDLFIVTRGRTAWSITLGVVVLARLLRRRRILCANFVMSDSRLALEQQDLFSASQVIHLRPLVGAETYRAFLAANPFVRQLYPNFVAGEDRAFPMEPGAVLRGLKAVLEALLAGPAIALEPMCRAIYGRHLRRRARSWQSPAQVRLTSDCLKLHTRSHRTTVLDRFERLCSEALRSTTRAAPGARNSKRQATVSS